MIRKLIIAAFVLATVVNNAYSQTISGQLSANETRGARQIARSFSRRLLQTKDIRPLITEFFRSNFFDGYLEDSDENWFFLLDRSVALRFDRADLERLYIAEINWFYLCDLYFYSRRSYTEDIGNMSGEELAERVYPPDVLRIASNNPHFRAAALPNGEIDDSAIIIRSVDQLRSVTETYEQAGELLRRHANEIGAGRTRQYRESVAAWEEEFDHYSPSLRICAQGCLGLPEGTRLISVKVPSLTLEMVNINGQMKIVKVVWYPDSK